MEQPIAPPASQPSVFPRRRIGVIGAGQLARMMVGPAAELGLELIVLANSPMESAAQVCKQVRLGAADDAAAVKALAAEVDVLTFEHEHIPQSLLHEIEASGVPVHPASSALKYAQDKLLMRQKLTSLNIPCPRWWQVDSEADLKLALEACGGEIVVKTVRGGYDGNGVRIISEPSEVADWLADSTVLLAEEKVPFTRELAIQVARNENGEVAVYPTVETLQKDGRCYRVLAPAPDLTPEFAAEIAQLGEKIAVNLGVTGMLAVELFEVETAAGRQVLVNELAMRPHNSGHWSMDGCESGQFEQHLRAVANLPLGSTVPLREHAVMVNLLGGSETDLNAGAQRAMALEPAVKVHLYGKEVKPNRKVGHVNITGNTDTDLASLVTRAHAVEAAIIQAPEY